ncbi:MAG: type II secretion system F family protein [Chloroflexota bacterium]
MSSLPSSPKRTDKSSFKDVSAADLFYQLTFMSAIAGAGLSRSKVFEIAARSTSPAAAYFAAINNLVEEFRYNYPEACRIIAEKAKSEDLQSFLFQLSDALKSGEPLPAFLAREAQVSGDHYSNQYETNLESLKKWSDAFSSIIVSVALIVIINLVSTMIYSMGPGVMAGMMATGAVVGFFGSWVISRAAPQEKMVGPSAEGSADQRRTLRLFKILGPAVVASALVLLLMKAGTGWLLIVVAGLLIPVGIASSQSDKKIGKKDDEISSFLRSVGGMASSTGTTLKEALTKIDLSSFPTLQPDIKRLSMRLTALINPELCWQRFAAETGSHLIKQTIGIFYDAVNVGGDPERVGFLCSLFASKTALLRTKRRAVAATFTWLTVVMHGVVGALMIFVLEIIHSFMTMIQSAISPDQSAEALSALPLSFGSADIGLLNSMTVGMIILLAVVNSLAAMASDGGYKLKTSFYLSVLLLLSGVAFLVVPPTVARVISSVQ